MLCISVGLGATVLAVEFVSLLPQQMTVMPFVCLFIEAVDAGALNIGLESIFIGSLVDALATCSASEIALGLLQDVVAAGLLVCLLFKQLGNDLGPRDLLLERFMWAVQLWVRLIQLDLRTGLRKSFFNGGSRECLMDAYPTGTALKAAPV